MSHVRIGKGVSTAVTGGSGFIGSHLADALTERGAAVRIIDIAADAATSSLVELRRADVTNAEELAAELVGVDVIFHLAGNSSTTISVSDPAYDLTCNAVGTLNVLEACRRLEVQRIVYVSSASVYGRPTASPIPETHELSPIFPYGASKRVGEDYCRLYCASYDLPVVIARPFCVYGPGENPDVALVEVSRYLRWYLSEHTIPVVGDAGMKTRDFVFVTDVAEALILLAIDGRAGESYNIGSGRETSMHQLIQAIELCGGGGSAEAEEDHTMMLDSYRLVADIRKIRALGYSPRIDLHEGLRRVAKSIGDRPAPPSHPALLRASRTDSPILRANIQ